MKICRVIEKDSIQNHGFNVYLTPTTTKRNYNWVETPHQKEVIANKVNQELILGYNNNNNNQLNDGYRLFSTKQSDWWTDPQEGQRQANG